VRRLDAAFATTSAPFQGGVKPPHSKALRAFSWPLGARQPTAMSDCHENTQSEIPRCAPNDNLAVAATLRRHNLNHSGAYLAA